MHHVDGTSVWPGNLNAAMVRFAVIGMAFGSIRLCTPWNAATSNPFSSVSAVRTNLRHWNHLRTGHTRRASSVNGNVLLGHF